MDKNYQDISESGIINTPVEQINERFCEYKFLPYSKHQISRLIKAKRFGKWHILKTIDADYAHHPLYIELMNKEFDILFQLEHPNIVRAINKEFDQVVGACIVMEYIDGVTLKEFIKVHQGNIKLIRKIGLEIIDAMIYFHSKQIIHRDLKPNNILITHNGNNVKIIDFGLSDTDYYDILKQPGGTVRYCAPEQKGKDAKVDGRLDIYAFGMILIEFFAGEANKDLINKLPYSYRQIAKKCTQDIRDERYITAVELRDAFTKKNPVKFFVILGIFALLTFVGTTFYFYVHKANQKSQYIIENKVVELPASIESKTGNVEPEEKNDTEVVTAKQFVPNVKDSETQVQMIQTAEAVKDLFVDAKVDATQVDTPSQVTPGIHNELMNLLKTELDDSFTSAVGKNYEKLVASILSHTSDSLTDDIKKERRQIISSIQRKTNDDILMFNLKNYAEYIIEEQDVRLEEEYKFLKDSIRVEWYRAQRIARMSTEKIYYSIDLLLGKKPTLSKGNSYDPNSWEATIAKVLYEKGVPVYEKAARRLKQAKTFSKQVEVITKYLEEMFGIETKLREGLGRKENQTLQEGIYRLYCHFNTLLLKDSGISLEFTVKRIYLVINEKQYKESYLHQQISEEEIQKHGITSGNRLNQKGLIYIIPQDWYFMIL